MDFEGNPALSRLFFAVPEAFMDRAIRAALVRQGFITREGEQLIEDWMKKKSRVDRIRRQIAGKPLFGRLLAVAPELGSVGMVDFLSKHGLVDKRDAHILRIAVRSIGSITADETYAKRAAKLFGSVYSNEMVALLRDMDVIDVATANRLRASIAGGGALVDYGQRALRTKTLVDWLLLARAGGLDERTLRFLKLTGVINPQTANALIQASRYGGALWTVWEGAQKADGLAARMAYVVSGSFSWEALDFLKSLKIYDSKYDNLMNVAVSLSQQYNREMMQEYTHRRYRVKPNESPIKTFARASRMSERKLSNLLAQAAKETGREAARMKPGLSAAQKRIRTAALHRQLRELWEGVGHLTIFGERDAARAALEAMEAAQSRFAKTIPHDVRMMMEYNARSGLDSFVSRQENTLALSRRVYGNINIATNRVDRAINIELLKGSSPDDFARSVRWLIDPNTPGGVSYAARRLARTEIANAFHTTTIRSLREQPWVQGMKWNLSGSHGRPDICNQYAEDDHDDMGAGVFKKANVPGKPHPQCLCYITAVQVDEFTFIRNMKRGYYNDYISKNLRDEDATVMAGTSGRDRAANAMKDYVLPVAASAFA